ncbi:hypothetical protein F5050DRAFT_871029 [Lentinula boryana]|uniref:Uncharacterized protein n=1 Tax=Lentinula boryana TaxID=40481 RepID=A0ABQ8Q4G0_9AGAR|nr:hypothetical protein F5050DRAFT_871029 [Lentinula boryana]
MISRAWSSSFPMKKLKTSPICATKGLLHHPNTTWMTNFHADVIVLPLGTSDLDIIDEADLEMEGESTDEIEPELSIEKDKTPIIEDPGTSLQQEVQDLQEHASPLKEALRGNTITPGETVSEALNERGKIRPSITGAVDVPSVEFPCPPKAEPIAAMMSEPVEAKSTIEVMPKSFQDKEDAAVKVQPESVQEMEFASLGDGYSVVSNVSEEDDDFDVDGDFDVESISGTDIVTNVYEVEEVMTEGRLTVDPEISESYQSMDSDDEPKPSAQEEFVQNETNSVGPSFDEVSEEVLDAPSIRVANAMVENDLPPDVPVEQHDLPQVSTPFDAKNLVFEAADKTTLDSVNEESLAEDAQVLPPEPSYRVGVASLSVDVFPQILSVSDAPYLPSPPADEVSSISVASPPAVTEISHVTASDPGIRALSHSPAQPSDTLEKTNIVGITNGNDENDIQELRLDASATSDTPQFSDPEELTVQSISTMIAEPQAFIISTELSTPPFIDINAATQASAFAVVETKSGKLPDTFTPELLTRKSVPVLQADPYPASLSTPGDDAEGGVTDEEVDEIDQDSIISNENSSSNSSVVEEKPLLIEPHVPRAAEETDETGEDLDMDLQYPDDETTALAPNPVIVPTASVADELDYDAEGDIDPDFVGGHSGIAPSELPTMDDPHITIEKILAEHALAPASQVTDIESQSVTPNHSSGGPELDVPPHDGDADVGISGSVETHAAADMKDDDVESNVVESHAVHISLEPASTPTTYSEKVDKVETKKEVTVDQGVDDALKETTISVVKVPDAKAESSRSGNSPPNPRIDDIGSNRSSSKFDTGVTRKAKRKRKTPITLQNRSADGDLQAMSKGKVGLLPLCLHQLEMVLRKLISRPLC